MIERTGIWENLFFLPPACLRDVFSLVSLALACAAFVPNTSGLTRDKHAQTARDHLTTPGDGTLTHPFPLLPTKTGKQHTARAPGAQAPRSLIGGQI